MPSYEDELAQIVAQLNRAAPASRAARPDSAQSTASLDQLLVYAARRSASDVLLIAGAPVILRVNGAVTPVAGPMLNAEDTRNLLLPLLTPPQYEELQRNKSVDLYSDLLLHDMGDGLADGISQGQAGPREFRSAPLWGLGQRIFFLHDGRTTDLMQAIAAHQSAGSEANLAISNFNSLIPQQQQDLLNFLRSL